MREQYIGLDLATEVRPKGGGTNLVPNGRSHEGGHLNGFYEHDTRITSPQDALRRLDRHVAEPTVAHLGPVVKRYDIPSTIPHFNTLPGYQVEYPAVVKRALGNLFREYNQAFTPSVDANRQFATDYQYALDRDAQPMNRWVQVDMVGLPDAFLKEIAHADERVVREVLRHRIFEIENSLAMYNVMRGIFADSKNRSPFTAAFDASLDALREKYDMPIAVLAVTDPKYNAIKATEFGKRPHEPLSNKETRDISGFDKVFNPEGFVDHLRRNGGKSGYLLYVRASDPVEQLRKPGKAREINALLANPYIRRAIKEASLTFNLDDPQHGLGHIGRINDTKAYLPRMGMAYRIDSHEDGWTLDNGQPPRAVFHPDLKAYLINQGIDPAMVEAGTVVLRAKPLEAAYGGYGHIVFDTTNGSNRQEVKAQMRKRGPYILQAELQTPTIINASTGEECTYADRIMLVQKEDGDVDLMTGFRMLMPKTTTEAAQHRVHGNIDTRFVQIA